MPTPSGEPQNALPRADSGAPSPFPAGPALIVSDPLLLVLGTAMALRPTLWSEPERLLVAQLRAFPPGLRQLVGRLVQRRSGRMAAAELAAALDERALALLDESSWCTSSADTVVVSPGAAGLVAAAVLVVFGDDHQDLSFFPRLAVGRLALPASSRCAAQLAALLSGGPAEAPPAPDIPASAADRPATPSLVPEALASRAGLDAYLEAHAARRVRLQRHGRELPAAFARALAETTARAGQALALLGAPLTAARHWTALLWQARACLAEEDPRRRVALRALRRAPLAPGLATRLWEEVWRDARARSGRMIAAHLSGFALYDAASAARWRERSRAPGRPRPHRGRWRVHTVQAWLDRDAHGQVVAQGEGVEAHALRRLAQDGWQGVHAEGELWLALATLLYWHEIQADVAGAWVAPLQRWPLDWRRWGFARRRRARLEHATATLIRTPQERLARAYAELGEARIHGWFSPPPRAAAEAIVTLMAPATLGRLLMRVLEDPHAASGLPDLVAWRGRELALWEVKSPHDALSDRQISWLTWLIAEEVVAGELRVDERLPTQGSWFAPSRAAVAPRRGSATSASTTGAAVRARGSVRHAAPPAVRERGQVIAIAGRDWSLALSAQAPLPAQLQQHGAAAGALALGAEPLVAVTAWNGRLGAPAISGWARPVSALMALPALAVLVERRLRRRVLTRRWYPLPSDGVLAALVVAEALPDGGIGQRVVVLERPSGFLVPAAAAEREPVCLPRAELEAAQAADQAPVSDWSAAPDVEPLRPERLAEAWGFAADLQGQLALIGDHPYCLMPGPETGTLVIATAASSSILWTMSAAPLLRDDLSAGMAGYWR